MIPAIPFRLEADVKRISVAGLVVLAGTAVSAQERYPFVGQWDCEVATFTFTNTTYNNGSETLRMTRVEKKGKGYILTFPKNYRIGLSNITRNRMDWSSAASGDGFSCKRLK